MGRSYCRHAYTHSDAAQYATGSTKGRQLCSITQQAAQREGSYAAARNRQHATGRLRECSYAAARNRQHATGSTQQAAQGKAVMQQHATGSTQQAD